MYPVYSCLRSITLHSAYFAKLTENTRYDQDTGKVILSIPNPNLALEIQNFIEDSGAYVEKQLNAKLLQIRAEYR